VGKTDLRKQTYRRKFIL